MSHIIPPPVCHNTLHAARRSDLEMAILSAINVTIRTFPDLTPNEREAAWKLRDELGATLFSRGKVA